MRGVGLQCVHLSSWNHTLAKTTEHKRTITKLIVEFYDHMWGTRWGISDGVMREVSGPKQSTNTWLGGSKSRLRNPVVKTCEIQFLFDLHHAFTRVTPGCEPLPRFQNGWVILRWIIQRWSPVVSPKRDWLMSPLRSNKWRARREIDQLGEGKVEIRHSL